MISRRTVSPFDAEAKERLRHMGLLDVQDKANKEVIRAAAQLHAGMFYDDLCDCGGMEGGVFDIITRLSSLRDTGDSRQALLYICVSYDRMSRPLPDLIWWISGNQEILPSFINCFVDSLRSIVNQK